MRMRTITRAVVLPMALASLGADCGTLSDSPLFLQSNVPPNVLFALSVEYPTANTAAYQGSNDYSTTNTYLGLFDSEKCYTYDATNNWFAPANMASSHTCTNQWSGNFLNWATMTGLDEFRYAMTGGNRYQDTATLTVLERAYQSGQGGTSNFPNKTYTGTDSNPYPAGSSLTIVNQGKGTQMSVTLGGSGTATCTNPTLSGSSFSCSLALQTTGETGTCSSWTGSGTSTSPYQCQTTAFSFTDSGTPSSVTVGTKSQSTITANANETVTCSNPSYSGGVFSCSLQDSNNNTGSCSTWVGSGVSGSPFTCTSFGSFGGQTFVPSGNNGSAVSFTAALSVTQPDDSASSCSIATSSPYTITCSLKSGRSASCTPNQGSGSSTSPYQCTSGASWTISGSPAATYVSNQNSGTTTSFTNSSNKTRYYYKPTSVTYSLLQNGSLYYIPSYSGSDTASYYYYSTYTVNFGGTTNFYVRAKVCDPSVRLESNCTKYGASTYKPNGVIQENGEKMRFGVFSYYNANDIDNAVMRSKLKYVAPQKWTSSGTTISNSNTEWSSSDGTLVASPDPTEASNSYGGAVTNSGVINYINKFGTVSRGYKTYDNVGKLYYEALKYLRGLSPTADFYSRSSTSNNDGFPVITSWDDPQLYSCQKNYIITMGDTHTHCDKRLPGGTSTSYGSSQCTGNSQTSDQGNRTDDTGVNVGTWTNSLGTLEGITNLANIYFQGSASYYMSGLAYWAAKNDIRPDDNTKPQTVGSQKVKTYVIDVQEYGDTGAKGSGTWPNQASQYWYAAKYGGVDSFDASGNPQNWSTTISGYSGAWPKTLLPAGNPAAMIAAVRGAISAIESQTGSGADVGLSTGDLRTGNGTNLYSATYNSSGWSGDVLSYHMASDLTISTTPAWSASTYLNPSTLNPSSGVQPWTTRRILSFNDGLKADGTSDGLSSGRQGVDFLTTAGNGTNVYNTNFSARQQALLDIDPSTSTSDGRGSDRVDYIRGDNSNEGTSGYNWRSRSSSIGDFVNSSPVYVRYPSSAIKDSSYSTYASAVASRTPVLYVGSNDGMLHAFDASDDGSGGATSNSGKELMAYVPAAVYANLNKLTWPSYSHKYFVDGTPTVADAQLTSSCSAGTDTTYKCWRTVLIGGLNGGGQGIYALNITDPSSFSSASAKNVVMWEFTDRDDADLGFTFSQPLVRKMNNGKWAVIFGNGYNNTYSDGKTSSTGRAYLYILFLDGPGFDASGRGNTWTLNTDYRKIELKSPSEGSSPTLPLNPPNGLSTVFALDKNNDNAVDYLYAGDRFGNLWKIDVSSSDPSNWGSAFGSASTPLPLFTASTADTTPKIQQITTSPLVTRHPSGGYLVLFGTGSYVDISDPISPYTGNSFYGIWDQDSGNTVPSGQTAKVLRSQLQKQATLATASSGGTAYALQSDCVPQYNATAQAPAAATTTCPSSLAPATNAQSKVDQQLGWVLDLQNDPSTSNSGERYISAILPILENNLLTFVTLTPSSDPCQGGGYDFRYDLDVRTGGPYAQALYFSTSGSTTSALTLNFTVGAGASAAAVNTKYPSGRKMSTAIGQNPKRIFFQTDANSSTPSAGCSGFVKGRPCKKIKRSCDIVTVQGGCTSATSPTTGRISWRQITQ